jgi:hypothetical protein
MSNKAPQKTPAQARLETIKSLLREVELIGDMVMTAGLEGQQADSQDQAVGCLLGVEREIASLQKLFDTIVTLHRVRA